MRNRYEADMTELMSAENKIIATQPKQKLKNEFYSFNFCTKMYFLVTIGSI